MENGEPSVTTVLILLKRVSFAVRWDSPTLYLPSVAPSSDGDLDKFGWTNSDVQGVNLLCSIALIVVSEAITAWT